MAITHLTALTVESGIIGALTGNTTGTHTGAVTGAVTGNTAGVHTGAVTGNVTGNVIGDLTGNVTGNVTGGIIGANTLTKADSYALAAAEIKKVYTGVTMSEADKVLTLGLAAGQMMFVNNDGGTNAFTVKNVAGDTGTTLAANKLLLVIGSATANASIVKAID